MCCFGMFLLRSLDSLLMIAGAKFDVPLVVTPSSLSGSNFGMSAPLLACFETDLKGVVKAVSEDQFLLVSTHSSRLPLSALPRHLCGVPERGIAL